MEEIAKATAQFDFEAHQKSAVERYSKKRHLYDDFTVEIENILRETIETRGLKINVIQGRAKSEESFGRKVATPSEQDPNKPKYANPMKEITDLAGVRVITFFPSTVGQIGALIQEEFQVLERVDHIASAEQEERLGYQSVHYLVGLGSNRSNLSEYKKFAGLTAEIQVRTVLQHAWAEIEHDIRYKSTFAIPHAISRRFMALAGLLEIADREFEAIQKEDAAVRANAAVLVLEGRLGEVEVTPDSLRSYLDHHLGPDNRISDFAYEWMAKILRNMGFQDLAQVDDCIRGFDDDKCSRIALGNRSGQISRFEVQLAASMGENFIASHLWSAKNTNNWWAGVVRHWLEELKKAGVQIGSYQPKKD